MHAVKLHVRNSEDLALVLEHYVPHLKVTLGILDRGNLSNAENNVLIPVVGGTAGVVGGSADEEVQSLSPILPEPETVCKVGIILFLREMPQISKIHPPFSLRSYLCSLPMDLFQEIMVYEWCL